MNSQSVHPLLSLDLTRPVLTSCEVQYPYYPGSALRLDVSFHQDREFSLHIVYMTALCGAPACCADTLV